MANKPRKESSHNVEFAKGGKDHMFPQQASDPMKPGTTRDVTAADTGEHGGFAKGGSGKMFGFQPSNTQTSGRTSSY